MKIFEFEKHFPDEESCRNKFRDLRLKQGVVCPKCGCTQHYWKSDKGMFQCKECGHRQSLRYGTVMQGSKLPFRYWFIAMHLLTATKHTFSAAELQRQLGHNRYQPIWEMVHKLRSVMGQRDSEYMLTYSVELDEGFFTVGTPRKEEKMKQGSRERKATVLVMAESVEVEKPMPNMKKKKVGHLKMLVIPDEKKATITGKATENIHKDALVSMDASHSHSDIEKMYKSDCRKSITQEDIDNFLPWVHTTLSNAKSLLLDTYHGIKREYLQEYLNEFCYKFNRRYFGENLFDRLLMVSAGYTPEFQHRTYRHKQSA